ncbi:hypothetical protein CEP88_10255 [Roseobacter denitrificans]|uniref:Uncharacterized protein n=2 Tax=Roseobacter denitrificans TaxID=2434 RepID=Q160E0_ROSDO|nr:hypothetical protein RD1_4216 [Roseobacter denitrificans OCh 114]AVL54883.1 hypothetical protein CEP88_10255 [Roseobacter denitrificans]
MGWDVLAELTVEHEYYAPNMPPVTLRPNDAHSFDKDGLLLRQQGGRGFILAEEDTPELPAQVAIDLHAQSTDVITVTAGGNWDNVPQIDLTTGTDHATLDPLTQDALPAQTPGHLRLAQLNIGITPRLHRKLHVAFKAIASHWAYHVIGPGHDDVMIEDPDGRVSFSPLGVRVLPDGRPANVLRSSDALPARARPGQRFSLSKPGPFGPRTLIPVLPAPQPLFATVPAPDGTGALIQSDIYVSIF